MYHEWRQGTPGFNKLDDAEKTFFATCYHRLRNRVLRADTSASLTTASDTVKMA
jgi:hypothetical protein